MAPVSSAQLLPVSLLLLAHETLIYARLKPLLDIILSSLVPEAQLVDFESVLKADIVIVALPRTALPSFDFSAAQGLVVDATNPWESAGTAGTEFELPGIQVPVIRTLNHITYDDLASDSRALNTHALPRAVAVVDAGQEPDTLEKIRQLVESFGSMQSFCLHASPTFLSRTALLSGPS